MPNFFISFLHKIESLFKNPKVQAAFNTVSQILLVAEPIVADIGQLTSNKTFASVAKAYEKYGIPLAVADTSDPTQIGNLLLNLATTVVNKNLKTPAAQNLVNTAVQIAVTAGKAGVP